jgi:hypothetical protein
VSAANVSRAAHVTARRRRFFQFRRSWVTLDLRASVKRVTVPVTNPGGVMDFRGVML